LSHASQKLKISLHHILRSEFAKLASEGWERHEEVALPLDTLRSAIEKATRSQLILKGVLPHDNVVDNFDLPVEGNKK